MARQRLKRPSSLLGASEDEQQRQTMMLYEGLLAAATRKGDFKAALEIVDRIKRELRRR